MRFLAMSVVLSLTVVLRADSEPEPKPVAPPKADIRGKAERVTALKGEQGSLHIVGTKEKDTQYDQAVVTVPATAKVYRWKGGKKVDAKFADIKKGDLVQASFTGDIRESFPIQATATEVVILPATK
jgi:hypothetical protein